MRGQKTILCVEEYETLLKTLATVLEKAGYTVLTARTASEALVAAKLNAVDAVLLDFRLCPHCPGTVDSMCVAEQLKGINSGTKVLVWCADGSCLVPRPPCAEASFMKPMAPMELLAKLDALFNDRQLNTRAP